jgi:phage baseplate assembly protein gpV
MIEFTKALYKLNPSVVRTAGDVAYDADGNEVAYDKAAVQAYVDAHAYIAKRAAEYPSIGDQLDALWKGGAEAEAMLAKVQAVKNKYPKGA